MSRLWEVAIHQEGDDIAKCGRSMDWRKYAIRIRGNGLAQRIATTMKHHAKVSCEHSSRTDLLQDNAAKRVGYEDDQSLLLL